MAYEKGFKVVQNFPLGIQSVNRAAANNAAIFTTLTAKHSNGVNGVSAPGISTQFGRHLDVRVAQSVAMFRVLSDGFGTNYLQPADDMAGALTGSVMPTRLGTGAWRIYVQTSQLYGAVATPVSSSASDYKATCRVVSGTTGGYLDVSTWDVATAARADMDFSLVIWGIPS